MVDMTTTATARTLDPDSCYRAVRGQDRRFDGVFYTAVTSTGIYCRPSCPARTPARCNVRFYPTAAAAQQSGFRACKRCRPDATPGSPDWDIAADTAGRAMRLVADGVVDRDGVPGLATRLGYTPRHLTRLLTAQLGAGPLALARAHRAQTARILVETTDLSFAAIAFASGFSSVRQFNDTVQEVYATTPTSLRGRRCGTTTPGRLELRLAVRAPFDGSSLLAFLGYLRTAAQYEKEWITGTRYGRTLRLPHGYGQLEVELGRSFGDHGTDHVPAVFALTDLRDLSAAVERTRRLLDADADPVAVSDGLGQDPLLGPLVAERPGLRVPGHVNGAELAVRAVLGQQISVARARTLAADLTAQYGTALDQPPLEPNGASSPAREAMLFPTPDAIAAVDPGSLPMPRSRANALTALCRALADGDLDLDRGGDREAVRGDLLAIPGIGPWTADYIALRALGDPDVFLGGDLGTRHALQRLGGAAAASPPDVISESWRPWRSYAQLHLWTKLMTMEES